MNGFDSNVNYRKTDGIPNSTTLSLSSAKNEEELGQLILTAIKPSVLGESYNITLNDLTHTDGVTTLSKNNFTAYNGHYVLIDENWVVADEQPSSWYPNGHPILPLGYYVDALVPFDAAVYNGENVIINTNGDGSDRGNNQTIYVNFSIPSSQKAGVYSGYFTVSVTGNGILEIPVSYTVYDFTLPTKNNAVTAFEISLPHLKSIFGNGENAYNSNSYTALYDYLLDFNVNAGRIPATHYYDNYVKAGTYNTEWEKYVETLVRYYDDQRVSSINLYVNYSIASYTASYEYKKNWLSPTQTITHNFNDLIVVSQFDRIVRAGEKSYTQYGLQTMLDKLAKYCISNNVNLFDKLYIRIGQNDEPNDERTYAAAILSYNSVRNSINYAMASNSWTGYENIRASLEDLAYIVTCEPNDKAYAGNKIVDAVNNRSAYYNTDENNASTQPIAINYTYLKDYVPMYNFFISSSNSTAYNNITSMLSDAESDHTHVWWYGCQQPVNPYPCYDINANQVICRSARWAQFGMNVEGELYYGVNWWRKNIYDRNTHTWIVVDDGDSMVAKLTEDEIWQGLSGTAGAMGDGVLVYPVVARYSGYNANNGSAEDIKFCATYRLFNVRESIDDYNYLCYAQSLIDAMASGSAKTTAQNTLNNIVSSTYVSAYEINGDADTLRSARSSLVTLIEGLVG